MIRPYACFAIFLVSWAGVLQAAYGQTFPAPRALKINNRVYVLLGPIQHANRFNQGYMINSTVIVGDKGVILVDSGGSDEVGGTSRKPCAESRTSPSRTW